MAKGITTKQRAARRRNIKVAQMAKKKNKGAGKRAPYGSKLKGARQSEKVNLKRPKKARKGGGAYGTEFKKQYEQMKKMKYRSKEKTVRMAHEQTGTRQKSKKMHAKYSRVERTFNKAYKRKGSGKWVPKSYTGGMGKAQQKRVYGKVLKSKGGKVHIPRRMRKAHQNVIFDM